MNLEKSQAEEALRDAAREYHRTPTKGKISITPTKPLLNQRDLSLAYSPGVAYPCLDVQAGVGHARRVRQRQVALVGQRLGRRDRDLALGRRAGVFAGGVAQGRFGLGFFDVQGGVSESGYHADATGFPGPGRAWNCDFWARD